jgi:hypothetical protein
MVCNRVAQSILDSQRGEHPEFVFTYQDGEKSEPHRILTMNNTGWQNAMRLVGCSMYVFRICTILMGMRLREAEVRDTTNFDGLWHATGSMTNHYNVAQARELLDALNLISDESNRTNVNLQMLFRERDESLRDGSLQSPSTRKIG